MEQGDGISRSGSLARRSCMLVGNIQSLNDKRPTLTVKKAALYHLDSRGKQSWLQKNTGSDSLSVERKTCTCTVVAIYCRYRCNHCCCQHAQIWNQFLFLKNKLKWLKYPSTSPFFHSITYFGTKFKCETNYIDSLV